MMHHLRGIRAVPGLPVFLAALAFLVLSGGARAQSKFSMVLLGERFESGDVRSIALGGGAQLLDDSLSVLQLNPAALTVARRVTFGATQYFSSDQGRSDAYSERDVSFKFSSFNFAFPLTDRLRLAIGYRARYDGDGHIVNEKTTVSSDDYAEFYNRKGGLFSFPFSAAVHVSRFLRLGGYFSIEQGSYENRWDIVFADPEKRTAASIEKRTLKGHGFGAGAIVSPLPSVSIGATFEGAVDYDTDVRTRYTNSSSNESYSETTHLPERWIFALSWRPQRYFRTYASYAFSDFTKFEGFAFPADRLYREETVALGVEYRKGVPLWGLRLPLRGSVTYERLPFDFPAGERIDKLLVGFGTGLHFRSGKGKLDFTIQGGTIGDRGTNGLSDRVVRVYLGVSGSEVWRRERQSDF